LGDQVFLGSGNQQNPADEAKKLGISVMMFEKGV
jgi:hypothetical protein